MSHSAAEAAGKVDPSISSVKCKSSCRAETTSECDTQAAAMEALIQRVCAHPQHAKPGFTEPTVLQRFLIARRYNVDAAYKLWEAWATWRTNFKPERLTREMVQAELDGTKKILVEGHDREGRPIFIAIIRNHRIGEYPLESTVNFIIYTMETMTVQSRECADGYLTAIFDCAGIGLQNLDYKLVLKKPGLLTVLQDYFPETLRRIFLLNSSAVFRAFYKCCLPFMDENLKSKIVFVTKPEDIVPYVDMEALPQDYKHMFNQDPEPSK